MKKTIWIALVAVGLVTATSSSASAAIYGEDDFLSSALLGNSGDAAEEAALEAACGCSLTLVEKEDINDSDLGVTDNGLNFIDVAPDTPGYFLLKFGGGANGKDPITADTFFFENIHELDKLVWADSTIDENGGKANAISHYAYSGDVTGTGSGSGSGQETSGPGEGPEPALLSLLGVGLLGAAARMRKRS